MPDERSGAVAVIVLMVGWAGLLFSVLALGYSVLT